jgi:hypothetical protein
MARTEDVQIVGWGHTPFGRLAGETLESMIVAAAREALNTAGLHAREIDEIVRGTYHAGLLAPAFPSSLALQADDDLLFTPSPGWKTPAPLDQRPSSRVSAASSPGTPAAFWSWARRR